MEARVGIEPAYTALQAALTPLHYRVTSRGGNLPQRAHDREVCPHGCFTMKRDAAG